MLEATGYPRNPSFYHISQCDGPNKKSAGSSKTSQHPTGGGGRGRGDGKGNSSGRGGGKGKGKCKCITPTNDHCISTDDEHLANLLNNNAPTHLNPTNVYTHLR